MAPMRRNDWLALGGWLLLTFAAAALGSAASIRAADFYATLAQPHWAPPATVFGPVWGVLYLLMALAAWLAWRHGGGWRGARAALGLFVFQLVANTLWSWLFFAWHLGALAFIDIILLCALLACTLVAFWRIRALAGLLLLPYLAWVSFAAALCFSVWRLNPQAL
ncbi:TspO/MBR family protein [Luteimonas mephitis]|uniref:TspO/MBR family protein n=1 Tax=Luteimonas mephitis TaxID=83615 RepID=UPI003A90BBBB